MAGDRGVQEGEAAEKLQNLGVGLKCDSGRDVRIKVERIDG